MSRDRHGLPADVDYWTRDDVAKARRLASRRDGVGFKYAVKLERFKRSPTVFESRVRVAV